MTADAKYYPHSRLFVGPLRTVVASGPHIQVLETQSGNILHTTVSSDDDTARRSGLVRCIAVDSQYRHIASVGEDDKKLKIWELDGLKLLSERELPKKPTDIQFTRSGQTILTSDKFGDVFSYPLHPSSPAATSKGSAEKNFVSHENPHGSLILGHTSLLTGFLLTSDEQYIITADRDEHIRVSWYPQGYNIERYCLGHTKFVSAIHIPLSSPSYLISGGGDPVLKLWEWMSGRLVYEIKVGKVVEPFIKVRVPKDKKGRWEDDGGEDDDRQRGRGKRKNKGKQKGGKRQQKDVEGDIEMDEPTPGTPNIDKTADNGADSSARAVSVGTEAAPELLTVLAIHKISSVSPSASGSRGHVLFSAKGASALFAFALPNLQAPDVPIPEVVSFDFGKPVLDFVIKKPHEDSDAYTCVWVLLDGGWNGNKEEDMGMAKVVEFSNGKFSLPSTPSTLLSALNSITRALIKASHESLASLDSYSDLSSLPKYTDPTYDPMNRIIAPQSETDPEDTGDEKRADGKGKRVRKKVGKMRTKRALAKLGSVEGTATPSEEGEREIKRPRSEAGGDGEEPAVVEAEGK